MVRAIDLLDSMAKPPVGEPCRPLGWQRRGWQGGPASEFLQGNLCRAGIDRPGSIPCPSSSAGKDQRIRAARAPFGMRSVRMVGHPGQAAFPSDGPPAGAAGGTRTPTPLLAADFKSAASTIPPQRHCLRAVRLTRRAEDVDPGMENGTARFAQIPPDDAWRGRGATC